jgi:cytochrome c2
MSPRIAPTAVVSTLIVLALAAPALAAGSAARGKEVFQRCAFCHSLAQGENGVGPSLHGLFGSKAGTVPDYNFSKAMKNSGIVWNEASLKKFLADPQAAVPGTKMESGAVDNPQALDDLVAYLKAPGQ